MKKRFAACLLALTLLSNGLLAAAVEEKNTAQAESQNAEQTVISEEITKETEEAKPTFSVSSATAKPGDTVELTVDISNNPGITSMMVGISYNNKYLSLASEPTFTGMFGEELGSGDLKMIPFNLYLSDDIVNVSENGVFATILFKVAEDAPSGEYVIDVSYKPGNVYDANLENVFFETVAGKITVEGDIPAVEGEGTADIYNPVVKDHEQEPEDEPVVPLFADTEGHWAVKYINEATELGLFKGNEDGLFNPEGKITRAQFITVLWRKAGSPEVEPTHSFTDVDNQNEEFRKAIAWGYSKGYINGVSNTQFDPEGILTREAGMKMLHYYSGGAVGMETMFYNIYDALLQDSVQIADWAKKSVYWGIYYTLISGTSDTTISPKEPMTRAQMAKIMVIYHNSVHFKN